MKVKKINAVEAGFTGDEPSWHNWEGMNPSRFFSEYHRSFRFYNYYCNAKDLIPDILKWMNSNGYSKNDQKVIRDSNISIVVGSICRCFNFGLPTEEHLPESYLEDQGFVFKPLDFVKSEIAKVVSAYKSQKSVAKVEEVKRVSPLVHLENKVNATILTDLEGLLDQTIENADVKDISFDLYRKMREYELPSKSKTFVWNWLTKHYNELRAAYDKTDEDLVEGYSHLTRPQINQRIRLFEKLYKDLDMFSNSQKSKKTPRKKKTPSVDKQLAKLQYQKENVDYKIQSVSPSKVVGANRVLTFNTKTRLFTEYVSSSGDGFAIKGTTLQNVDENSSRSTKLRKPEEFLPIVLKGSDSKYKKAFDALTTKVTVPKNRINGDTILLRTFDK